MLGTKLKDEAGYLALPRELMVIFKDRKFPVSATGKLKNAKKTSVEDLSVQKFCSLIKFAVKFDGRLVEVARGALDDTPDYATLIIFYYFIAFVEHVQSTGDFTDFKVMLQALQDVIKRSEYKVLQKVPYLAVSAYVHCYSAIIATDRVSDIDDWTALLTSMTEFLTSRDDFPLDAFNVICLTAERVFDPISSELSKAGHAFLNFLSMIMSVVRIPIAVTPRIVQAMRGLLLGMNGETLRFLRRSINKFDRNEVSSIVLALPAGVGSLIDKRTKSFGAALTSNREQKVILPDKTTSIRCGFLERSTFADVLTVPPNLPQFPEPVGLLDEDITKEIDVVGEILKSMPEMKNTLVEEIMTLMKASEQSCHYYENVAAFLKLLNYLSPFEFKSIERLLEVSAFNTDDSVYGKQGKDFPLINEVRQISMPMLIKQQPANIDKLCSRLRTRPMLLGEFVMRLIPPQMPFKEWTEQKTCVIASVLKCQYYYQTLKDLTTEEHMAVNLARVYIFKMLDVLMDDTNVITSLFANEEFVDTLVPLEFERQIRPVIFGILRKYMEKRGREVPNYYLRNRVREIFTMVMSVEPTEELLYFVLDSLTWLEQVVPLDPRLCDQLNDSLPSLCQMLPRLKSSRLARQVLLQTISVFSSLFDAHALTRKDLSCIETGVKNVFGSDYDSEMRLTLASLVAGTRVQRSGELFIIRQPRALRLFLSLFINSKYFPKLIQWFIDLCKYSPVNAVMCHKGQLDSDILAIIHQSRSDPAVPREQIEALLKLFCEIACYASSLAVVRKFVSLFCQISERYLSRHYMSCLDCLQNLVSRSNVVPCTSFYDTKLVVRKLNSSIIDSSFTLNFWVAQVDFSTECLSLICLSKSEKSKTIDLEIGFNQDRLFLRYCGEEKAIDYAFRMGEWKSVTIAVEIGDKMNCVVSVDAVTVGTATFSANKVETELKLTVNGSDKFWLGPIGIFPYIQPSDAVQLCDFGYQEFVSLSKPYIHVHPVWSHGALTLDVTRSCRGVKLSHTGNLVKQPTSFSFLLNERSGLSVLLPMFAQLDMTYEDGTAVPCLLDNLIWVLKQSLIHSLTAQATFVEEKGFSILARLLNESNDKHVNYHLYLALYELLDSMADSAGKEQLLSELLLNVDLWMKADGKCHADIVKHWASSLIPTFMNLVLTSGHSLSTFLAMLRIYYFYDPKDNAIRCVESRARIDMDVSLCREYLLRICQLIAREKGLTDMDLRIIISHMVTCEDKKQLDDLLSLIKNLVEDEELMSKSEKLPSFCFLYSLLSESEIISNKAFDLILYAIAHDLTGNGQEVDIMALCFKVKREFFTEMNASLVAGYIREGARWIFPLCMLVLTNMNPDQIMGVLTSGVSWEMICEDKGGLFWTVMSLFFVHETCQKEIMDYLVTAPVQYWTPLYEMMEIVGDILGKDGTTGRENRHMFLVGILKNVTSKESSGVFIQLCRRFLFFRSGLEKNQRLESLYEKHAKEVLAPSRQSLSFVPEATARRRKLPVPKNTPSMARIPAPAEGRAQGNAPRLPVPNRQSELLRRQSGLLRRQSSSKMYRLSVGRAQTGGQTAGFPVIAEDIFLDRLQESTKPKFYFGIRMNEEGEWIDIDIAKMVIEQYQKYPDEKWESMIMLIVAFSWTTDFCPPSDLKWRPIDSYPDVSSVTVYNKLAKRFGKELLPGGEMDDEKLQQNTALYLESFSETIDCVYKVCLDLFEATCVKPATFVQQLQERLETEICGLSGSTVQDFINQDVSLRQNGRWRMWSRTWKQLTIQDAPWFLSILPKQQERKFYKRDFVCCFSFYTPRERRNFKFNDHLQESIARNTGSVVTAQELYEKQKAEIAKKYVDNEPLPIFDMIDDQEEVIAPEDTVVCEWDCELITAGGPSEATFRFSVDSIFIKKKSSKSSKIIFRKNIKQIFLRTHLHRPSAIEIFEYNGNGYFVNFPGVARHSILTILTDKRIAKWPELKYVPMRTPWHVQTKEFKEFFADQPFTRQWCNREISNFEYLMHLNVYSGRSFRNTFQYPFVPWILVDYDSPTLDLKNEAIYRDLSKPIGALNPSKLQECLTTYQQYEEGGMPPYMYSSAPVSPLAIYFWLVRMEPYTTLHTDMQSGRFDQSARLFASISKAWKLVRNQSGDFRELIPEFFFMPEFLLNKNGFDLGDVDGAVVNDVELPPWAKNPMDFVYQHRKALESDYVSSHLQEWIDLVWGEKQMGQKAFDAHNVFKPQMYSNIWETEEGQDPINLVEIETTLSYVGQIPPQLFDKPHPARNPRECPSYRIEEKLTVPLRITSNIVCAFIDNTDTSVCVRGMLENGEIMSSELVFAKDSDKKRESRSKKSESGSAVNAPNVSLCEKKLQKLETIYKPKQERQSKFAFVNSRVLCITSNVDHTGLYLVGVEDDEVTPLKEQRLPVTSLVTDGCMIATTNIDGNIVTFEMTDVKCEVPTFKTRIKASAVSEGFHMFVCASSDGDLMFCSLNSNSFVRTVGLDGARVASILITPSWGFVVVQLKKIEKGRLIRSLACYSVNGELIASNPIRRRLVCWHAWKSRKGFDYIVAADDENSIYVCEAYYCKVGERIAGDRTKLPAKIIRLHYLVAQSTIVVLYNDGTIQFVPYKCED